MTFKIGPTSETGKDYYFNSDAFINIAHGAVRSGKTIMATFRFITHVLTSPHSQFLIGGKTRDTIERNVIHDLLALLEGKYTYSYSKVAGKLTIAGKTVHTIGLSNEKVVDKIKGMTIGGAYIDEVTTVPQSSFEMILTRCSLPGAKVFCTTNPASPFHWLYTDYITNQKLIDEGYVKVWQFRIEDNPHLSKEYIDQMKSIYSQSSTNYRRNILGEWVSADGIIYDKFNRKTHVINELPAINDFKLNVGCDYGMSAPTAFIGTLQSHNEKGQKVFYVVDSEYHDPKQFQKSDREKALDLESLISRNDKYFKGKVYIPHDARSLIKEVNNFSNVSMRAVSFRPNTLECIAQIQKLFSEDRLFILNNENNQQLIKDIQNYLWDPKKQEQGIDAPLKLNDHTVDALRLSIIPVNRMKKKIKVN